MAAATPSTLWGAHVVHENDVAVLECRGENLLDVGQERRSVHRAVDDVGGREAIDAQAGDERHRLPVAVRNLGDQPLANWAASVLAHHLGRHRGLVDEHQTRCLQLGLLGFQRGARGGDIRTILLGGVQCFF